MGRCAILSFRLGGSDGVSIVAGQWQQMLESLGWDTVTVAGEGVADRLVAGLEIGASSPPDPVELTSALADADLVVVENLLTIPIQPAASRVAAQVLAGRPALLHHHDPPWQRARFASVTELPTDDPAWRHVTINRLTEQQMAERGITATTIYNGFDTAEPDRQDSWRSGERARLGVGSDEPLILHPVRAIERKNLPAAIALAEAVGATYWLTGPAEEDYGPTLDRLIAESTTRVIHRPATSPAAMYAACDLVVFPSTWEGFGNPPVEASIHRRPVMVGDYEIAAEQRSLGFDWPSFVWPSTELTEWTKRELVSPDRGRIDHNRQVALERLDITVTAKRLQHVLEQAGWRP